MYSNSVSFKQKLANHWVISRLRTDGWYFFFLEHLKKTKSTKTPDWFWHSTHLIKTRSSYWYFGVNTKMCKGFMTRLVSSKVSPKQRFFSSFASMGREWENVSQITALLIYMVVCQGQCFCKVRKIAIFPMVSSPQLLE